MSRRNLLLLLASIAISMLCYARNGQDPHGRFIAEAYRAIDQYSLENPDDDRLVEGALRGMVQVLRERGDEHSQYISREAASPFRDDMRQEFGGVGVRIRLLGDPPLLTVVGPPEPGTPAAYGGVQPGDQILEIDGQNTVGLTMRDVLKAMRGPAGKAVTLTVKHQSSGPDIGQVEQLRLVREIIVVPSVMGDRRFVDGSWDFLLEEDPRIAYVRISTFGAKTAEEFRDTMATLHAEGVQAMVLDLRENAGGALDAAIDICDLFLPADAAIVETRGRDGSVIDAYKATGYGPYVNLPLAVLVNKNSASASEIVAACLQDHQRAIVLGERSFGKGTVQRLLPLEAGRSLLKLTSASYWRPSGANIHRLADTPEDEAWGVRPDPGLEVKLDDETYLHYLRWRAARDLIAVDAMPTAEQTQEDRKTPKRKAVEVESEAESEVDLENDAAQIPNPSDLELPKEPQDSQLEQSDGENTEADPLAFPADFEDAILRRAIENLQMSIDASA